ncbi:hypothetical protein VV11_002860 [Trichodesmium erythraeum 21-75]|nr:hypothetical protein [Trichodesmium erythraeum 21-75]
MLRSETVPLTSSIRTEINVVNILLSPYPRRGLGIPLFVINLKSAVSLFVSECKCKQLLAQVKTIVFIGFQWFSANWEHAFNHKNPYMELQGTTLL